MATQSLPPARPFRTQRVILPASLRQQRSPLLLALLAALTVLVVAYVVRQTAGYPLAGVRNGHWVFSAWDIPMFFAQPLSLALCARRAWRTTRVPVAFAAIAAVPFVGSLLTVLAQASVTS